MASNMHNNLEHEGIRKPSKVRIISDILLSNYLQGLESCNVKPRQSSASRGVRSRQQEVDLFAPVKVETIPLLSPTMESELMREPWQFPREPASCIVSVPHSVDSQSIIEEENTTAPFSSWQENFQDLSGWCMANIQPRCDFPTGESTMATKLTGTRNEGVDVITVTDGATRDLMQAIGKKIYSGGDMIVGARQPEMATCVVPPQLDHAYQLAGQQQQQQQQQQTYFNNNNNNINAKTIIGSSNGNSLKTSGNVWMGLSVKPVETNTVDWREIGDMGIATAATTTTGLPMYQQQNVVPPLILKRQQQQPVQQRVNPDVLQTLETDATNGFDLLSYLCEDDIPSPGESVSTDSSRITDTTSISRLTSNSSAHIVVSPKTYEPITLSSSSTPRETLKSRLQAVHSPYSQDSCKLSPISSTSSETAISTRSSYQLRTLVKVEKPDSPPPERRSTRPRRVRANSNTSRSSSIRGKGRKRMLNDDMSDSDDDDDSYRETREKNNEASRKSRMNKKAKEMEMAKRANELEKDNRILKMKVEELEKLVSSMRNTLLRSALKREVKTNMF